MKRHPLCVASKFLLRWALKLTAAPLPEWDRAMLAELESIDEPLTALSWSLGCVTVLVRETLGSYCQRAGLAVAGLFDFRQEGSLSMRNAKIAALAVVAATFIFFESTSFRQAMSVAAETLVADPLYDLSGRARPMEDPAELDRLRKSAEQQDDAKMLAYVALHDARPQEAQEAADRAVAIDPQWTWVYYLLANGNIQNRQALIAKLQQWDPQNAAIYMLQADQMAAAGQTPSPSGNEPWVQLESRAFDCPKYDSYFHQQLSLEREVALRQGNNPFQIVHALQVRPFPNFLHIHQYADLMLASVQSSPTETVRQARRVTTFGERLMSSTEIEQFMGAQIALDGYKKLAATAPPEEQPLLAARIAQIHSHRAAHMYSWSLATTLAPNAVTTQASLLLILLAAFTMIASYAALLLDLTQLSRKNVERTLWAASSVMLVSCIVGYVSYLPFVHLWQERHPR